MKTFLTASAIAALSAVLLGPAYAQDAMTPAAPPAQEQPAAPASPSQSAQTDLTGQAIYSAKGHKIGTVSAMSTDAQGQQTAVVGVEKFLGLGGKDVLFPVSSLSPKSDGGYTTSLTASEIKKLPVANQAN